MPSIFFAVERSGPPAVTRPASGGQDRTGSASADTPLLVRLQRLAGLRGGGLAAIDRLCGDRRRLGAREAILPQGQAADRLFVLLDGWACSYRMLAEGRRQIVSLMVPGDICNLDVLYLRDGGCAIGTLAPSTVAAIDPQRLRALAKTRAPVRDALSWLGAAESAMLAERTFSLGRRSAREHVAHMFCDLLIRLTLVGEARGRGYTLPLTQDEIADVLGLTAVHVNRVVQGLRRDGLIRYVGKDVEVLDWDGLREAAQYRADYLHLEGIDGTGTDFSAAPWG